MEAKIRNDITNECNSSNVESIFVELLNRKVKNIILGLIYRPPNNMYNDFEEKIEAALSKIDSESKSCYILGYFNIGLLKHEKCEYSARFLNQMMSSLFLPTILKPTRITRKTATLIDNIFTNIENNVQMSGILFTDLSDHLPVFLICKNKETNTNGKSKDQTNMIRHINENHIRQFREDIESENWQHVNDIHKPNESYNTFKKAFTDKYNKHFPLRHIKTTRIRINQNPWITQGIAESSRKKNKLYKKFLKTPSKRNEAKYKIYRNKLTHIVRIAKKNYFDKKFENCKNDIKKTWDTIKELIRKKPHRSQLPTSFLCNNKCINNPKEIANNFNEFFSNIGPNLAKQFDKNSNDFKKYLNTNYVNSMFITEIKTSEVLEIMRQLKPNKSHGYTMRFIQE